jgi:hypothetical protein
MIIPLNRIIYDKRSRDGTWCCSPYYNHPQGCPNFPKCPNKNVDFKLIEHMYTKWSAVIETFDLSFHASYMKKKHPDWSDRQCRNPLYWQGGVRKRLYNKALQFVKDLDGNYTILTIPEANGINVFETMSWANLMLNPNKPDMVIKVMIIGYN